MDQLDAMRTFVAVVDANGISRAARALGLPVASVSRKLAALEAQLGARLASRTTRRMALTEAGRRYVEACRRVLADVDEAARGVTESADRLAGSLTVTAPVAFGRLHVLPVVHELLRQHPELSVRLLLADRNVELIDENVDVAVRIGALPDSTLVATRVGAVGRIACASPEYLARRGVPREPADLAGHDCISFSILSSAERWSFASGRTARSVPIRSRLVVTTAEAAIDAAIAGIGITRVLSYQAAAALAAGTLRSVLEGFEPPRAPVHVVHGEGRSPRAKVRAFVALATARLRAALSSPR